MTAEWVPAFGVSYRVGVDGVSLPLVLLTTVLTPLAIAGSWRMTDRPRTYLALLLVLETAMLGVFVSLDLFLFYVFWEAVLVPAYFLIGSFGGERRVYAAVKFFVYTLLGGLLMLVGIIALFWLHQKATGTPTFDYEALVDFQKAPSTQRWLFAAFFAAFAIKTPVWPFHTWLPDAYTEAPTTTTVLLAGVMSKLGVYGFLRYALPLFPDGARWAQPLLLTLAVVGILYCALVATMQRDFKTLVAYSSVSHLGLHRARHLRLQPPGAPGRGVLHGRPRAGHRWAVLRHRHAGGAPRHPPDRGVRRPPADGAPHGRGHAGPHPGLGRPARPGRVRGRVPDPARRLPREPGLRGAGHRRGRSWAPSTCSGPTSGCGRGRWSGRRTGP